MISFTRILYGLLLVEVAAALAQSPASAPASQQLATQELGNARAENGNYPNTDQPGSQQVVASEPGHPQENGNGGDRGSMCRASDRQETDCKYGEYDVKPNDSCSSIGKALARPTLEIARINRLRTPSCCDLAAYSKICLPPQCQLYTVVENDTCEKVASRNNLSLPDFYNMNPSINRRCTNLIIGFDYCVSQTAAAAAPQPKCATS